MKFITFRMRSHTERTRSLPRATQHITPARGRGPPSRPEQHCPALTCNRLHTGLRSSASTALYMQSSFDLSITM
jgi:hypothetical protein